VLIYYLYPTENVTSNSSIPAIRYLGVYFDPQLNFGYGPGSKISSESGSRVLMTKNCIKKTFKKIMFFSSKAVIYLSLGHLKGSPSYRKSLRPPPPKKEHPALQKRNYKVFYFCRSFLPSWIRIRIADPDPGTPLNPNPDPDPHHRKLPSLFFTCFRRICSPDILSLDPLYDLLHVLGDAALAQQFGRLFSKKKLKVSVADPGSGAFLTPDSGIQDGKKIWIRGIYPPRIRNIKKF
jgi:hypothetical protein